ncbi:hypothetical protein B0I35DRAFT_410168 [Stachybotrys elegans]|uniref:Bacteriophage T5 Orf172 DNA-binding domain-containing protein n=1 Tax=Stachybotrys elegans TaxID=80388 RepID=A0A8K0SL26_9HYPO|nr:hypothetical protein B0I35DRAFT_410168 [Stachybotrys elegans]
MAAPFPEELNTEASFDHASLQKTPTQRKPRQKKSYGGLQAGPSSSPIARYSQPWCNITPTRKVINNTTPPYTRSRAPASYGSCDTESSKQDPSTRNTLAIRTYNYLFVLKKPGTDEPGMLKIGITNNINRRISAIKSDCKYNEIQELPGGISYTGKLAAVAEALMLAELDAQKCLVNCCPKKTHTHTDRFEMANMDIVTEVFHRWLDFCSLAPWDDKGKLKPRWLARLDAHRQNFDTRGPEGHRNRLNVDWKSFVNVSLRQKLVHDLSTDGPSSFG